MLLRIIENPDAKAEESTIRIVLEDDHSAESFDTEPYNSPIYDDFHKTLAWYFTDYLQDCSEGVTDSGVVEKLIKFGQNIGDELLGEDHQLVKFRENIEEQGYENLRVQIESTRLEFFKELWELTILPDSKYVLSAVARSFVRLLVQEDSSSDFPELHYDLNAITPTQDQVTKILQSDSSGTRGINQADHQPLRVLYVVSRPQELELADNLSNSINLSMNAIASGGVIEYDIHQMVDWEQLKLKLSDKTRPVHILHYDGPIMLAEDTTSIVLDNSATTSSLVVVEELAEVLAENKVGALVVDSCAYLKNNQIIPASEGLAMIAGIAHQQGLGNVVGLSQTTNAWISGQCFQTLYSKIASGLELGQALVEARKELQSSTETSLMTINPLPFHPWSLLVHYSKQPVFFFESQQNLEDPDTSQKSETHHNKLFGFRVQMLPPLLRQVSDGKILQLVEGLSMMRESSSSGGVVSIVGEPGTGRTQLAHVASLYFAQKQQIDYGFYFDFGKENYMPNDMLGMIAPVLQLDNQQADKVIEKLTQLHCCFVLDDVFCREENIEQNLEKPQTSEESTENLAKFLQRLLADGHKVIVIGDLNSTLDGLVTMQIEMDPLSLVEQKIMAAEALRNLDISDTTLKQVGEEQNWSELLESMNGHPWLTKKLMPKLVSLGGDKLKEQMELHINHKRDGRKIEQFYEWQWITLKPIWQRLLILCSDVQGLLLEMLMTAIDHQENFAPAKSLFKLLGDENAKFSEGLDLWESSGFLSRLPHGRVVDSRCLGFLELKRKDCFDDTDLPSLNLAFSQVICEGIRLLASHVIKQPNPSISNNLLLNRRQWVKHFEALWFGKDFIGFIGVKNAFDQLLRQAKLYSESEAWSLDLLGRSEAVKVPVFDGEINIEEHLSWLMLASSVLGQVDANKSQRILDGVKIWRGWFEPLSQSITKEKLPLFRQVAVFLENFYLSQSNWKECIVICEKAASVYRENSAWQKLIQSLSSLAKYHSELGEDDRALVFEDKIMNEIPYNDAPPGYETQQIVDILLARLGRKASQHAQILLDQLRDREDAEKLTDMLDGLQSDIHYMQENYSAVLPYYCKLWERALGLEQAAQILPLKSRLLELEQKLGSEYFDENFERQVSEGTLKPKDYVSPPN